MLKNNNLVIKSMIDLFTKITYTEQNLTTQK